MSWILLSPVLVFSVQHAFLFSAFSTIRSSFFIFFHICSRSFPVLFFLLFLLNENSFEYFHHSVMPLFRTFFWRLFILMTFNALFAHKLTPFIFCFCCSARRCLSRSVMELKLPSIMLLDIIFGLHSIASSTVLLHFFVLFCCD